MANFVDYSNATSLMTAIANEIDEVKAITAGPFNTTTSYQIGDVVTYDDKLYRFKAAHSAGAWNASDVDQVQVIDLIGDVEVSPLSATEVTNLINLL